MKKETYLLILFILTFHVWSIVPIGNMSGDMMLCVIMAFMFYGYRKYKVKSPIKKSIYMRPFWWIILGIVLSMIPAYLYYDQGIVQSLLTYRSNIYWLIIPLLYRIAPTEKEIVNACLKLTFIMCFVFVLKLTTPGLFVLSDRTLDDIANGESVLLVGFSLVTVPIFYYLQKIQEKFDTRHLMIIIVCFLLIFLMQNRSTLFPIVLFVGWAILWIKSKYKYLILFFIGIIAIVLLFKTLEVWMDLIDETTEQLDDPNYNRNKAFMYFIYMANNGPLTYILGNGFLSAHSTPLMQDMMEDGVYNSDLGFVGFWNQYGIIPIIVFVSTMIYPLRKRKKVPLYLRYWGLQMLACSLTISYFGVNIHLLYYALFYYLLMSYKSKIILDGRNSRHKLS